MHIVGLEIENVKRISAVSIKPDGRLVQITGKNAQGKSSVLDSIWWALGSAKHIQVEPIRKGADKARIRVDLGELVVTRKWHRHKDTQEAVSSITVENADGSRFPTPQAVLDSLLGALTFDPLEFARMKPDAQFDALRKFVPGVDFKAIETANKGDFQKRTEVNRDAKQKRAAAEIIVLVPVEGERIDTTAIEQELADVSSKNVARMQEITRREDRLKRALGLEASIDGAKKRIEQLRAAIVEQEKAIEEWSTEKKNLQDAAVAEPPIPDAIDPNEVKQRLQDARLHNAKRDDYDKKKAAKETLVAEAKKLEEESEAITARMDARDKAKQDAIAAAKMPVDGITFGDGVVLFNGLPLEQASEAQRVKLSCAIAMAGEPRLRVILIRRLHDLDEDNIAMVAKMAEERDFQVWAERVETSGKVGIVMEDGHVKGAEPEAETAEA